MAFNVPNWLYRKLPKNFLLRKPLAGTLVFMLVFFFFLIIYKPFNVHPAGSLGVAGTLLSYTLTLFIPVYLSSYLLKRISYFSDREWNLIREAVSILIVLSVVGITIYFAGFLIEVRADRWNFRTFWNSFSIGFLIGIIPFAFFTFANYRFLFFPETEQNYSHAEIREAGNAEEKMIRINSQLKKEGLSFYPHQFLYAESDGNYIDFYLSIDGACTKKTIRNSITNIEQQLSPVPFFMRVHRAYIVNLTKVKSKKGNTLGYSLKVSDINIEIPVSRSNTRSFDKVMKQFQ